MQIQKRTMNWLPKPSTFAAAQAAAEKRRAAHSDFLTSQSSLADTLIGVGTTQSEGVASLAMKAAVARVTNRTTKSV